MTKGIDAPDLSYLTFLSRLTRSGKQKRRPTNDDEYADGRIGERREEKYGLVDHEESRHLAIGRCHLMPLPQKDNLIGQRRRNPSTSLTEELVEFDRTAGAYAGRCAVLQHPPTLDLTKDITVKVRADIL